MDSLPFRILDEILFKLDLKSVVMLQCTEKSLKSYISDDFKYKYVSRMGLASDLFHISTFGSNILFWHTSEDLRSSRLKLNISYQLDRRLFIGSCSGLFLLFVGGYVSGRLCVRNPLTNTSTFLSHSRSKLLPLIIKSVAKRGKEIRIGFAVDQTDQSFKIVLMNELRNLDTDETMYQFEISTGVSCWSLSETTIACRSSNLMRDKIPVYFHGYVHWLRVDGSILAFNPVTEQARLIPIQLPLEQVMTLAAADNELTLVTDTEEAIHVYALDSILTDHPEWVRKKRYEKGQRIRQWNIAAYDAQCLMLREKEEERYNGMVHLYDMKVPQMQIFSPSRRIMKLIINGISPNGYKILVKNRNLLDQKKRSIPQVERKLNMDEQRFNKRIRSMFLDE